jgi:hypothetical protein
MSPNYPAIFLVLALSLLFLAAGVVVRAQTSVDFNLEWHVIGSGGGETSSAGHRINGSIGQSMVGSPAAGSADFRVTGGYWPAAVPAPTHTPVPTATPTATPEPPAKLYLPAVSR